MNEPQDLDRRLDDWLADGTSIRPNARSAPPSTTPAGIRADATHSR